jgi:hypothetical protein
MIDTINATLDQRPESLNVIRVDSTPNILIDTVLNTEMRKSKSSQMVIRGELIGQKYGVPIHLIDYKRYKGMSLNIGDYGGGYRALPLYCTDYDRLTRSTTPTFTSLFSTDVSLVNFHFPSQMIVGIHKKSADLLKHTPRCLISNTRLTLNLFGGDTTSGRRHTVDSLKPHSQWSSGLVEYCTSKRVNLITAIIAHIASPIGYFMVFSYLLALRTMNTIRVAMVFNPLKASIVIRELGVKIFKSVGFHFRISAIFIYTLIIKDSILVVKG